MDCDDFFVLGGDLRHHIYESSGDGDDGDDRNVSPRFKCTSFASNHTRDSNTKKL